MPLYMLYVPELFKFMVVLVILFVYALIISFLNSFYLYIPEWNGTELNWTGQQWQYSWLKKENQKELLSFQKKLITNMLWK